MRNSFIVYSLLAFLFMACQENVSVNAKIILGNKGINRALYVKGDAQAIILPLETTPEALIGAYDKVLINDTVICVVDKTKSKTIFIYTKEGTYKTRISCVGRGAREYVSLDDVNLKKDSVLILDRVSRKMLYFNLNGQFCKEVYFKVYRPTPFTVLDDSHFAFYVGMPGHTEQNAEVIVTDLSGKIQKQYIPRSGLNSKQGRFHLPAYFARNKDGVFFIPVFENKIYHLTPDTIKAVFDFDFKEFMYPFDEISEKSMLEQEKKYSYFSLFYMTDDGIFVCFNHRGRYPVDICGDIHTALGDNRALLFVERKQLPGFARGHGEEMKSLHGEK